MGNYVSFIFWKQREIKNVYGLLVQEELDHEHNYELKCHDATSTAIIE